MKYSTDLDRVKKSLSDEEEREKLKDSLLLLVDAISKHYSGYGGTKEELRKISWIYFDFAMKKYVENIENKRQNEEKYKFSTYFSWYIKTSIETYLGISEEPLRDIPIRDRRGSPIKNDGRPS